MAITTPISTAEADTNPIGKDDASGDPPQSANPSEPDADSFQDPSDTLDLFDNALACAQDTETLEEIREEFNERIDRLDNESLREAGRIFLRHEKRIEVQEHAFRDQTERLADLTQEEERALLDTDTGRIGKGSLSPHRRRRFSIRPRKGLTLSALNARRKIDLSKYQDKAKTKDLEVDHDGE